ncbi:MAG: TMEM165/GDT1 family protein [Bdellovibrionota bacterium]
MEAIINSTILVFISEMGDKTQLLALVLAARFRKPIPILLGIFVATLLNHALASYAGSFITNYFAPSTLRLLLAVTFVGFGLWILIPDKDEGLKTTERFGAFVTTLFAFFIAEMGDKTQLATIALGAKYNSIAAVTLGTTLGMMLANAPAVYFGQWFTDRIPMQWVRRMASVLFIGFGIACLWI